MAEFPIFIFIFLITVIVIIVVINQREDLKSPKKEKLLEKEEKVTAPEPSEGSLTGKIARLKKLYTNGTLTKDEFEKAKNKLLK